MVSGSLCLSFPVGDNDLWYHHILGVSVSAKKASELTVRRLAGAWTQLDGAQSWPGGPWSWVKGPHCQLARSQKQLAQSQNQLGRPQSQLGASWSQLGGPQASWEALCS